MAERYPRVKAVGTAERAWGSERAREPVTRDRTVCKVSDRRKRMTLPGQLALSE